MPTRTFRSAILLSARFAGVPPAFTPKKACGHSTTPIETAQGQIRLYTDTGLARPPEALQRPPQRRRSVRLSAPTAFCSPTTPRGARPVAEELDRRHDYISDGFYAATPDQEMKSTDLEVNVLVAVEEVTARVQGAAKGIADDAKALKARDAEIAAIEKESKDKTGLRSDVVSFYNGGEYWLYRYKAYTDVRLVFAPEQQAAFYGGDPDNFTYPRYDLDMALFRVYENGKPLKTDN